MLAYLLGMTAAVAGLLVYFTRLERAELERQSSLLSNFLIFAIIITFVTLAFWRKEPVYDTFVAGAKEGFQVAVGIIPYLVAMLVAIGILRACGALDLLLDGVRWGVASLGADTRWVDGLPTALMRPLSGSGSRGMMHRDDEDARRRLVRRPPRLHHPGAERDDVLHPGGLLRRGRHQARALRGPAAASSPTSPATPPRSSSATSSSDRLRAAGRATPPRPIGHRAPDRETSEEVAPAAAMGYRRHA